MDGEVNPTTAASWPVTTVEAAVRRHATERPDDVAVTAPSTTLTWREVDQAADRAAGIIAATGGAGSRVAWLGQNDIGYPITLLATMRQRSVLVGFNWRLPDADLAASGAEVEVTHIFTSEAFAGRAAAIAAASGRDIHIEVVDQDTSTPWPEQRPAPALEPAADDMSMVFFTSGTTGIPKAVPLDRQAVEVGASTPVVHGFDPESRLLIVPPVFHLAGAYWTIYGLLFGARQVYLAEATPPAIVGAMAEQEITHAVFVPTLIRMLIDELRDHPVELPAFRHLAYGASAITVPMLREAMEVFGSEFCQVFGMTEAGGVVTYLPPQDHVLAGEHAARLASAGRRTVGVEVQVRDLTTRQPLPAGQSGELWFRTPFMAQGYINRPADSAQVFVDGWLNTRDVGYLDEDGYVYVEGRSDDMIITGGENVHPAEVETVLAEVPEILEAAVFGVPDEQWGRCVWAAVVRRTPELTEEQLVAHCKTRLAGYKVPRGFVFLDDLPKTATGKVTRRQLAELCADGGRR